MLSTLNNKQNSEIVSSLIQSKKKQNHMSSQLSFLSKKAKRIERMFKTWLLNKLLIIALIKRRATNKMNQVRAVLHSYRFLREKEKS